MMATRLTTSACSRSRYRVANAALFTRQNPIGRAGHAWWPGGRTRANPVGVTKSSTVLSQATCDELHRMISSTIDLTTPADASESIYVDLVR